MLNTKLLGSVSSPPAIYPEDVFSTYLYTGTGSTQTITNGIDLAGKGGLTWIKARSAPENHVLFDTVRGNTKRLISNLSNAESTITDEITSFNSNGFTLGAGSTGFTNNNGGTFASWTFREQAKFFDVVTWTGNTTNRDISHNLGSVPGMIVVKKTSSASNSDWWVWHRSISTGNLSANNLLRLNLTNAQLNVGTVLGTANSTSFQVGDDSSVNLSGQTYVAYLFAHDAGGFGSAGTDNVITCGSVTTAAGTGYTSVNLGYEPQYVLLKQTNTTSSWFILDVMRGMNQTQGVVLRADLTAAEVDFGAPAPIVPTATGFNVSNDQFYGGTFIYMAIRRPMKPPTSGTQVFLPSVYAGSNSVDQVINTGFTVDMTLARIRDAAVSMEDYDRLRGNSKRLETNSTGAEATAAALYYDLSNSVSMRASFNLNLGGYNLVAYNFRRASGFMDVVCYTGDNVNNRVLAHNLTVTPELVIIKRRSSTLGWLVNSRQLLGDDYVSFNSTNASAAGGYLKSNNATTFTISDGLPNASGETYVTYLFATLAGVSKVGSYTGNGGTQAIACGFTGGARFVLIKRTDATGDWYVYDTARGMTTLTDPYLLLNSTAAETATLGSVTTTTGGFTVNAAVLAAINTNAASYIFLAIA